MYILVFVAILFLIIKRLVHCIEYNPDKKLPYIALKLISSVIFFISISAIGNIGSIFPTELGSEQIALNQSPSNVILYSTESTIYDNTLSSEPETHKNGSNTSTISDEIIEKYKNSSISIYDKDAFKNSCIEITYNNLDKSWIGKNVTKEILFTDTMNDEYVCGATESYIEDYNDYQHTYRVYDILDCRINKSFPIYSNDVFRIYGTVKDVQYNYANGLNYPIIDMYYADYVREWGKDIDTSKALAQIEDERITEQNELKSKQEYYHSLNSDYTGTTKNIDSMLSLDEDDFKNHCDAMNYYNLMSSTEDLNGRFVKVHLQLEYGKIFLSQDSKYKYLNSYATIFNIDDKLWSCHLYNESVDAYNGDYFYTFFADNRISSIDSLKENDELIVYGIILNYENNNSNNTFDILALYIE